MGSRHRLRMGVFYELLLFMFTRVVNKCRNARWIGGNLPRRAVLLSTSESHGNRSVVKRLSLVRSTCTLRFRVLSILV